MLMSVGVLLVLLAALLVITVPMLLAEAWRHRRDLIVARQIRLTDAIHAELGARFAPVVEKPVFRPWRVVYPISDSQVRELGRVIDITNRVVGSEVAAPRDMHIVFTRAA